MAQRKTLPLPAGWEIADVAALQALERGTASEEQQRRALKFIIERLAGTYDDTFTDNDARQADFAQGKRKVGLLLVMAIRLNLAKFGGSDEHG